jgi:hypothetical protein
MFDAYAAHLTQSFIQKLNDNNILQVFVPGNCTSELQPLDVSGNEFIKAEMKRQFSEWYSAFIAQELAKGTPLDKIKPDLRIVKLRPIHATWLITTLTKFADKHEDIKRGFRLTGIYGAVLPESSQSNHEMPGNSQSNQEINILIP